MFELYDLRNNFSYYYDFYISAKEKSLSDAGKKNNISQSSLNRKGFELTLDGQRIYLYAWSKEKDFKEINDSFNAIFNYSKKIINNFEKFYDREFGLCADEEKAIGI